MENEKKIEGIFSVINKYAMYYGLLLGAFWVFRYLFFIVAGAGVSDRFLFLFYLLNIGTLLLMYVFFNKFKFLDENKPKGAIYCIFFMVLMSFYASFLEGAIMYAHFKFIDPAYFSSLVSTSLKAIEATPRMGADEAQYAMVKEIVGSIYSSKFIYIAIEFVKNIILGLFLGVILNFVVANVKKSS